MTILILIYEFFKIGLFSVGGGMATLPFLFDLADKYEWLTTADVANMVAISESTPGPLGINMATFAGYQAAGIPGGIAATLALILPGFVIIYLIAGALEKYRQSRFVNGLFSGVRPAATGLILAAGWSVFRLAVLPDWQTDWTALALFALIFGLLQIPKLKKLHPVLYIGIAAVCGIIFSM